MTLPWRKRVEYSILRWQARLETIAVDRFAPWVVFSLLWLVLSLFALARSRELSQGEDLASAMQTVWLIGKGFTPDASLLDHNYLFEQASFLMYPVALLTKIFPTATTLMILQAGALALGVVPLWRIARRVARLRVGASAAILAVYSAYAAVHAMNLAGFHVEVLALPAILGAVHRGFNEQWYRYSLWVVVILAARADLGLAVAGLGILWMVEGKRQWGALTALVGISWFVLALFIIQPAYGDGVHPHLEAFASYGEGSLWSVLGGIITSPGKFLQELFSQLNFRSIITLLAPLLFLPMVAPRYLLPVVPLYGLYLVADVPTDTLSEAQQAVPVTAFLFVATCFALAKTGRIVVEKVNVDRRVLSALLLTAAVFFIRDSVTSPYGEPWAWGRRGATDGARLTAVDFIPDDAVVRASPKILPLLTERTGLFLLDTTGPYRDDTQHSDAADRVNWIVFDSTEATEWDQLEIGLFTARLKGRLLWQDVYCAAGITVLRLPSDEELARSEQTQSVGCDPDEG